MNRSLCYVAGHAIPTMPIREPAVVLRYWVLGVLIVISACGGGGGGGSGGSSADGTGDGATGETTDSARASATFMIRDGGGIPVSDAVVTLGTGADVRETTTAADGAATFPDLATGNSRYSVNAPGFGPLEGRIVIEGGRGSNRIEVYLLATDAWAMPRLIVLGTRMIERSMDGSEMKFSAEVAVIDSSSNALETLADAQFSLVEYMCDWDGPRGCASDADGNATGFVRLAQEHPLEFGLLPPAAPRPFIAEILVERSDAVSDWGGLKPFFASISAGDAVSLASVQRVGGAESDTVYGPFTDDGETYFAAIDQLAVPAGGPPSILDSLLRSIRRVAVVESSGMAEVDRVVLVALSSPSSLAVTDFEALSAIATQLGVRVGVVGPETFGYPEVAVRTGGPVALIEDPRQWAVVFGAMQRLLDGTAPRYRMTFSVTGEPGTFAAGGNAKVMLKVSVPTSIRHHDPYARLDVAIP